MSGVNYNDTDVKTAPICDGVLTLPCSNPVPGDYDTLMFITVDDGVTPKICFNSNGLQVYSSKGNVQWRFTYEGRLYSPRGVSAGAITTYDYNGILTNNNGHIWLKVDPSLTANPYAVIGSPDGLQHLALLQIETSKATNRALILKGFTSQSENLQEWRNSSDAVLAKVGPAGLIQANSGFGMKRIAVNEDYTVLTSDTTIGITDTSTERVITLPAASACENGQIFMIVDESGAAATHNITIDASGADLINGQPNKVINTNYGITKLYSNGSNAFFIY